MNAEKQLSKESASNDLLSHLEKARNDLLDQGLRNRLINTPRHQSRSKSLEIVNESSEQLFRLLVTDRKSMSFVAGRDAPKTARSQAEPGPDRVTAASEQSRFVPEMESDASEDIEESDESDAAQDFLGDTQALSETQTDSKLQTKLDPEQLQKRLLSIYYDSQTFEEEQGVSILYLALGFLKWFEAPSSDKPRYAPLVLVPVDLERRAAGAGFRLKFRDEEVATNLSLQAKLKTEFGVIIPELPDIEELSPAQYCAQAREAVSTQSRWEVLDDDVVLGFFSFAKYLMYRDLDPANWPEGSPLNRHPLIAGLLRDGFFDEPPICDEQEPIDPLISPENTIHVVDSDSSQTVAIEEVRLGRHLVIQGPPGTGKSQTITNLIATAVHAGKRVLFVAEKMAALNVVKSRLDAIQLGDVCLELHSHKSNKRAVLAELDRTLKLGAPKPENFARHAEQLQRVRDRLNHHAQILHTPLEPAALTPYQILGELVRLRAAEVRPADFILRDPCSWTQSSYQQKRQLLDDALLHLREVGNPAEHPWRGVQQTTPLLPGDHQRLAGRLTQLRESLTQLIETTRQLVPVLRVQSATTSVGFDAVQRLARLAQKLASAPPMDRFRIAGEAWKSDRDAITRLVETVGNLTECRTVLQGVVAEVAWTTDVAETRRNLAAHGRSFFRWFFSGFRKAQATLRGILNDAPPTAIDDQIKLVDQLIRGQKAVKLLDSESARGNLGQVAFGALWRGADSDAQSLAAIDAWERECREAGLPSTFRDILANLDDPAVVAALFERIREHLKPAYNEFKSLAADLQLDLATAFGVSDLKQVPLTELLSRVEDWTNHRESISRWIAYHVRKQRLETEGLGDLAQNLADGRMLMEEALDRFQLAYCEELMRETWRQYPELSEFEGQSHEQLVAQFRQLDQQRIVLARKQVAIAHYQKIPRAGGSIGEMNLLQIEINRRRNHKSIRQLLKEAGTAVQSIKPVFMMSPISVAQFLTPGALQFDLLLIDEASQVRPVDALGAVARARQMVVVGDDRQLPPTMFFSKVLGDDAPGEEDNDGVNAADLESILGLCVAQRIPQRMLRWHYRSMHHSLIAVSNREFYDSRLYVVPSPQSSASDRGLKFHHVRDGVFDRGGSATNRVEATAVALAVLRHIREYPRLSLGIGTFSVAQRDAILDELEVLRKEHPETEEFFAAGRNDPFFVKNLENIQGDERDVIFISVGYARDSSGFLAMSFGPLSRDGGERRLNVLITRARERCEVFSSITAEDIDLNRAQKRGAFALKTFLQYAATGILDVGAGTDRDFDSDFEREVAKALQSCGYEVVPQVGVAGFFIDLAVFAPEQPGRYLVGVECDGAQYHSSRSARDRDRLRQQVLEDRGWTIHRIWSTDWFNRPEEQLRKLLATIEEARSRISSDDATPSLGTEGAEFIPAIERAEAQQHELGAVDEPVPYREADFPISEAQAIHDVPVARLAEVVAQIVRIESPIHAEEVARRVTTLWGQLRAGRRIASAVEEALEFARRKNRIRQEGAFYHDPAQASAPVRCRQSVQSANLKKPEFIAPAEFQAAITQIVTSHPGATPDEVSTTIARRLGFKSTSAQLKDMILDQIHVLQAAGQLQERDGKLFASRH